MIQQPDRCPGESVLIGLPESSFWWAWGQFIDHDMINTPIAGPTETPFPIAVPTCDPQLDGSHRPFDPNCTGTATIAFSRSAFINDENGGDNSSTRIPTGLMLQWSMDQMMPAHLELRTLDGTGHLKVGTVGINDNLLPLNVDKFPNEPNTSPTFFLAGDVRANENPVLTALQTLFVREHNFWADHFAAIPHNTFNDDDLYNRARAMVCAEIQKITYTDFLPFLIGKDALTPYTGYNPNVDPSIANVFGVAAWRFGHSLLNAKISLVDANNQTIANTALQSTFFAPNQISNNGIEPYLRGIARQKAEEIDGLITDGVRNFRPPRGGGFDLPALNIARARSRDATV